MSSSLRSKKCKPVNHGFETPLTVNIPVSYKHSLLWHLLSTLLHNHHDQVHLGTGRYVLLGPLYRLC